MRLITKAEEAIWREAISNYSRVPTAWNERNVFAFADMTVQKYRERRYSAFRLWLWRKLRYL